MANKTTEQKLRESFLRREIKSGSSVTDAVFRCMGQALLRGDWMEQSAMSRYRAVVDELQLVLDALDAIVRTAE